MVTESAESVKRACTYLSCDKPAIARIVPAYGVPWFGCKDHAPAMATALSIGNPDSRQARTEKLA